MQPDDPTSNSHGFLEANINGIWGSVCGTGFSDYAANITCQQLGFRGGVAYYPSVLSQYGKLPMLMTEVMCVGNEMTLDQCSYNITSSNTRWCDYYAPRPGLLCYHIDRMYSYYFFVS